MEEGPTTAQPYLASAWALASAHPYWLAGTALVALGLWGLSKLTESTLSSDLTALREEAKEAKAARHGRLEAMILEALAQLQIAKPVEGTSNMGGAQATPHGPWESRTYTLIIDAKQLKDTLVRRYSILHELWHVAIDRTYPANKSVGKTDAARWSLNFIDEDSEKEYKDRGDEMERLYDSVEQDVELKRVDSKLWKHLLSRLGYAGGTVHMHFDVVLSELYYYLFTGVDRDVFLKSTSIQKIMAAAGEAQDRRLKYHV